MAAKIYRHLAGVRGDSTDADHVGGFDVVSFRFENDPPDQIGRPGRFTVVVPHTDGVTACR